MRPTLSMFNYVPKDEDVNENLWGNKDGYDAMIRGKLNDTRPPGL